MAILDLIFVNNIFTKMRFSQYNINSCGEAIRLARNMKFSPAIPWSRDFWSTFTNFSILLILALLNQILQK